MQKLIFLLCLATQLLQAQQPAKPSATDIYHNIQKLNTLGTALYFAAHPDDENTRLIAYLANHDNVRTGYLSLTRGDGGQNLIGPELRELLGVMRTQELLAARRVDGGQQFFSRANDFGYSKHPDETFDIWNKDEVLSDVVKVIREFKPDVIVNRFNHRSPGTTHGHHTASAMLAIEAFDIANKKTSYPEQLNYTTAWQPKRLFFNTSWWFYGSKEKFEKADKSNMINVDVGVYYPLKGMSNNEIASVASSQHLCQGFGRLSTRGEQQEYLELIKGNMPTTNDLFEGIDITWNRVKGGKAIGNILNAVESNFNFTNPSSHIPELLNAYNLIAQLKDNHWKTIKTKQIKAIIEDVLGLYIEASATSSNATRGQDIDIDIEILNRSGVDVQLINYQINNSEAVSKSIPLTNNTNFTFKENYIIPLNSSSTTPYWLDEKGTLGMYKVDDANLIGKPETPRALQTTFNLLINKIPFSIIKPVVHRYAEPDKGELYKPFEIVPEVSAKISEKVFILDTDASKTIEVTVTAHRDSLVGDLKLAHPNGWQIVPAQQNVSITNKGDSQKFTFTLTPPKTQSEGKLSPMVTVNGKTYSRELVEIDYNHIPFQTVLLPSESKIVRLDIKTKGQNIGYIEGAGDVVPESLEHIGYKVTTIKPSDITTENLSKFDAVVIGIRAYNVLNDIKFKQQALFNYVNNGGTIITQYNTNRRVKVDQIAPYELELSRDRVTDENAAVKFLAPEHAVLNYPNKITQDDFKGWTQERGLYFPNKWDKAFTPILSMHDKGESAKDGSLLIAKYGKGYYIYTGLSFFREFPAGVPGAYRLFANMVSIGKE